MNVPGNGNNIVDGINTTAIFYLKEQMEPVGILRINDT